MKIAYCYTKREKNKFIGAILIISEFGFPIEFKYSEPVIPTKLQSILYGNKLDKYIFYDIIIPELIKSLENKPDLFVVESLRSLKVKFSVPVIAIFQTSLEPLEKKMKTKKIKDNEYLVQYLRTGSPIRIEFKAKKFEDIKVIFEQLSNNIDIIEPINRIVNALEELGQLYK